METKKEKNYLLKFILFTFIIFMVLYISNEKLYYEYRAYNKKILTEEAIDKFEGDISENKNILESDYVIKTRKDYSNKFSNLGYNTTTLINKIMNKGLKNTFKVLSTLFYD